jgi:CDP-diacylglycerol--glycerol-3-phosphate 3-phosphatidyltransferase
LSLLFPEALFGSKHDRLYIMFSYKPEKKREGRRYSFSLTGFWEPLTAKITTVGKLKVSINKKEILYISNMLSLSRIFILPLIVFGLTKRTMFHKIFTLGVMTVAMMTDGLDGYLARRRNEVSALGKILDPIGDKVCIGVIAIVVTILRDFPWWAMGFIILRDMSIVTGGVLMVGKWTVITSSNIWGKATSLFQSLSVIAYAFGVPHRSYPLTVAIVFTGVSSISYGIEFFHLVREQKADKD